jgi:hypothetical protein
MGMHACIVFHVLLSQDTVNTLFASAIRITFLFIIVTSCQSAMFLKLRYFFPGLTADPGMEFMFFNSGSVL